MVNIAFGVRNPETDIGSWNGAFVYCQEGEHHVCGVFMDGKDYVGYPQSLDDAIWNYNHFKSFGWKPMSADDIRKTSGIQIQNVSSVEELERRQTKKTAYHVLLAAGILGIVVGFLKR